MMINVTSPLGIVPKGGTVVGVTYTPSDDITGNNTNSRTVQLFDRGPAGAGTALIAELAFVSGVNGVANVGLPIPLSVTPADLLVTGGDVLDWVSDFVGGGLADPGGVVEVEILPNRAGS